MDWLAGHVYLAQWFAAIGTLCAVLIALFGQQFWSWFTRPILRIEFERAPPFVRSTAVRPLHEVESRDAVAAAWVRIRVRNAGRSQADGCTGQLLEVRSDEEVRADIDPIQLRLAGVPQERGFDAFNLPRGGVAYLNVVFTRDDEPGVHIATIPGADFGFDTRLSRETWHELTILVSSANARPVTVTLPIYPAGSVMPPDDFLLADDAGADEVSKVP